MVELAGFLDAHGRTLFSLLYRITLREDISEDLMQELFLKLHASQGFHAAVCPLAYARRVALHLAFDWRRRNQREGRADANRDLSDDQPSPLDRLVEAEEVQGVLNAMAGLAPRNCELLTLRYIQQESYETMAKEAGKTPHQIRALCYKALTQLRLLLAETHHHAD